MPKVKSETVGGKRPYSHISREIDYEDIFNSAPPPLERNPMSIDVATLAAALRGNTRPKSYSVRIPIGSKYDAALRPMYGNKGNLSWEEAQNRSATRYRGAGRYSRYPGGIRRRGLRSSGLRLMPRRSRRYGGRGGYWMQKLFGARPGGFWDTLGDGVAVAGNVVTGGGLGQVLGGAEKIHRKMTGTGMYMGQGAYTQSNSLVDSGAAVSGFNSVPDGNTVTVSHREYISDIYGPATGNFTNTVFEINPGLERTFPWLSQIACNYDEYTLGQLMFTYRPTVTEFAAASGQQGQVIMATQYNANDQAFTDKRVMMQYDGAMSSKVSCEQIHGVECDPSKISGDQGKYVRNRPVLEDMDRNNYDHGQFNIAIADIPSTYANQSIGELWVSYTVELRKPKFYANKGLAISKDIFVANQQNGVKQSYLFGDEGQPSDYRIYGQQNVIQSALLLNNLSNPDVVPGLSPQISVGSNGVTDEAVNGGMPYAFKVVIPAYWAGSLDVDLNVLTDNVPQNQLPVIYRCYTSGNITPIRDIVAANMSGGSTQTGFTFGISAVGSTVNSQFGTNGTITLYQKWHIRVQEASGGIDNTLYFVIQTPDAISIDTKVCTTMLTLTEYNTGFNYKVDGNNDDLMLVDKNGKTVSPF